MARIVLPFVREYLAECAESSADAGGGVAHTPVIEGRCALDPLQCMCRWGSRAILSLAMVASTTGRGILADI